MWWLESLLVRGVNVPVISVDLASKDYSDIGVVALSRSADQIVMVPIDLTEAGLGGRPVAEHLVSFLVGVAEELGATAIGLDGPQAWKSADNGSEHSRVCEARLRTQGKTGIPGVTKPGNYLGFISFCIETFDVLDHLGWPRFGASEELGARVAVETFPTAAWRALDLPPLPGKSRSREPEVKAWTKKLLDLGGVDVLGVLTHDQLQAAVAGLGILALSEGIGSGFEALGMPPFQEKGVWLEGYIINPRRNMIVLRG